MKIIFSFFVAFGLLLAAERRVITEADKNIIDAQKREQILREYERIEAVKSELESYRTATKKLFDSRQAQLLNKEIELNKTLALIMETEKNITAKNAAHEENMKELIAKNEKILEQLNKGNSDKMLEAYVKMKDGKVAEVLGAMPANDAAKLLYRMEAKKISSVLSKMDANKAVELTDLIKSGAIFDNNGSKDANTTGANTADTAKNTAPNATTPNATNEQNATTQG